MSSLDVVVPAAVRAEIGSFGEGLNPIEPHELAGIAIREAAARSGVDPLQIKCPTVGNCIRTDSSFACVARIAAIFEGV